MLRDFVCGPQQLPETTDGGRGKSKNLLLKDLNEEKSLLWFWESSPPQLSVQSSVVRNQEDLNTSVNKDSLFGNSDSSFVSPEREMPKDNREPTHTVSEASFLL